MYKKSLIFLFKLKKISWIFAFIFSLILIYDEPELLKHFYFQNKNTQKQENLFSQAFHEIKSNYSKKKLKEKKDKYEFFIYYPYQKDYQLFLKKEKIILKPKKSFEEYIQAIFEELKKPKSKIFFTTIPPNSELKRIKMVNGKLILNLNSFFFKNYYGRLGHEIKIAQIVKTLTQLKSIKEIQFNLESPMEGNKSFKRHPQYTLRFSIDEIKENWEI